MALRCMNPQVIVCDELGTPGDAEAVAQGVASALYSLPRYTVTTRRDCAKSRRWPRCWIPVLLQRPRSCPGAPVPVRWRSG